MKSKENRKTDIVLKLKPVNGRPKGPSGLLDTGLFTGNNNLHAIMDTQTCLWSLAYDHGKLPPQLKQRYTGFHPLMKHVTEYMRLRNIEISEVQD